MNNSLRTFSYLFGYLPFTLRDLRKIQRQKDKFSTKIIAVLSPISLKTIQELSSKELIVHVQQKIALKVKRLQHTKNQMPQQ